MTLDFEFIYDFGIDVLELGSTLWNFLGSSYEIGGTTYHVYTLLFGGGLVALILLKVAKKVVPLI